jgi:maleylpyruvate isomerase
MKLYGYWRSSCSWRVRIALNLKGLEYEYVPVHLLAGEQHSDAHAAKNPMEQVPVLELAHDGRIEQLGQSMAIIEYLEQRFPEPALLPKDAVLRARARQLAEIVNSGMQPLQNLALHSQLEKVAPGVDRKAFTAHFLTLGLGALEALAAHTAGAYLVGDQVSVADVFLVPQLYGARRFGIALESYSTLVRVETRLAELEAFAKAHADRQPDAVPHAR